MLPVHAFLLYTTLRLAAFVATTAVLIGVDLLIGTDISWLLLAAAGAVLSGLLSLKLLARPRAELAVEVVGTTRRWRAQADAAASSEDVATSGGGEQPQRQQ